MHAQICIWFGRANFEFGYHSNNHVSPFRLSFNAPGPWAAGRGSAFCKTLQTQQQLDLELPQILAGESDSELNSDYTIHSRLTLN